MTVRRTALHAARPLDSISQIHNSAVRTATGAFRSSPIVSIYADAGIKTTSTLQRNCQIIELAESRNSMHPLHKEINGDANEDAKSYCKSKRDHQQKT